MLASPGNVSPENVHHDGLGNVVSVVARHDLIDPELHGAPVQRLSPEDSAEGAVVLETNLGHDLVHRPAVQILVRQDLERYSILVSVPLHCLQRVVSVAGNSFV